MEMTDLKRHSEGIWRSIYIFSNDMRDHVLIIDWFRTETKKLKIEEYSWCHYGEVKSHIHGESEKAHITFRVSFLGTVSYDAFRADLEKIKDWKWEDHGYDEPLWVKKAYVIGTKLYEMILEAVRDNPDVSLNNNFLRLMFHGFFNDAHYNSKQETEFYMFLFQSYLLARYGLRAAGMNETVS